MKPASLKKGFRGIKHLLIKQQTSKKCIVSFLVTDKIVLQSPLLFFLATFQLDWLYTILLQFAVAMLLL